MRIECNRQVTSYVTRLKMSRFRWQFFQNVAFRRWQYAGIFLITLNGERWYYSALAWLSCTADGFGNGCSELLSAHHPCRQLLKCWLKKLTDTLKLIGKGICVAHSVNVSLLWQRRCSFVNTWLNLVGKRNCNAKKYGAIDQLQGNHWTLKMYCRNCGCFVF